MPQATPMLQFEFILEQGDGDAKQSLSLDLQRMVSLICFQNSEYHSNLLK